MAGGTLPGMSAAVPYPGRCVQPCERGRLAPLPRGVCVERSGVRCGPPTPRTRGVDRCVRGCCAACSPPAGPPPITRPTAAPLLVGTLADLARTKSDLLAEHALLRQQLLIPRRQARRPRCTRADRALLVLLARRLRAWRPALLLVQPETVLRWQRRLFQWHWRRTSQVSAPAHRPPLAPETMALIREMAAANLCWPTRTSARSYPAIFHCDAGRVRP